jgi:hypothetical protein
MPQQGAELQILFSRIERLERQNRFIKRSAVSVGVLLGSILLMGQVRPNRTIEAERFVVRDSNGKVRAAFGMEPSDSSGATLSLGSTGITTVGAEEKNVIYLHAGSDLAWLIMRSPGSNEAFNVRVGSHDTQPSPQLSVSDRQGYELDLGKTDLLTSRTGESHQTSAASVVMFGKDKNVLWSAP